MASFDVEKGAQHQSGLPQQPLPVATAHQDSDFPPRYEEALNANLRNFEKLERQIGKGNFDEAPTQPRKRFNWKRHLLVAMPVLLFMVICTAVIAGMFVFRKEQHAHNPAAVTVTRRHITTVFETITVYHPVPSSIAAAATASIFSAELSASRAANVSPTSATTTTPLPSVNMAPTTTTTPLPSVVMLPSSTASTLFTTSTTSSTPTKTANPLGIGFCGPPGSPCLGGRDAGVLKLEQRGVGTPSTVTKHLTITVTGHTTTTVPIPASILDAASSYYKQWSSNAQSIVSDSKEDMSALVAVLSSEAAPPPLTMPTVPTTFSTSATTTASDSTATAATVPCANYGWLDPGCFMLG